MKKYKFLGAGDVVTKGDEYHSDRWKEVDENNLNLMGYTVDEEDEESDSFRRPIPFTGKTQFLMCISSLVTVIVDCGGKTQEEIEDEASALACQKILTDPESYIHLDNVHWEESRVDDDELQPGNEPGFQYLQSGDTTSPGDEWFIGGEWVGVPLPRMNVAAITTQVRRPIA